MLICHTVVPFYTKSVLKSYASSLLLCCIEVKSVLIGTIFTLFLAGLPTDKLKSLNIYNKKLLRMKTQRHIKTTDLFSSVSIPGSVSLALNLGFQPQAKKQWRSISQHHSHYIIKHYRNVLGWKHTDMYGHHTVKYCYYLVCIKCYQKSNSINNVSSIVTFTVYVFCVLNDFILNGNK